jgi:hypothetical protein
MKQIIVKLITFTFFVLIGINGHAKEENVNYVKYVDEIVIGFAKEMKKDFGVVFIGSGGSMPYDVDEIDVKFIIHQRAMIEEARELEVKATEKLLQMINDHEKIRPYLKEYPFTSNRTNVSISFYKPNNEYYHDGSVAIVSHVKDIVYYDKAEPTITKMKTYKELVDLYKEPYVEALKIIEKKNELKDENSL